MNNKLTGAIILSTIVILGVGLVVFSKKPPAAVSLPKNAAATISFDHDRFEWGNIPYGGGKAKHEFSFTNTGSSPLIVANLKTSCTCTTVQFISKNSSSQLFSMHQVSDWTGTVQPGETAKVQALFDPAFHGPQGVGPIQRVVSFDTNDPTKPYVEFNLSGEVVKG